jgi:quercetin dioxygenase-like cupin family protein
MKKTSEKEVAKGRVFELKNLIKYQRDSVVSKTLVEGKAGTLTLFAFDAGQGLSEHIAPFDATVLVLDGIVKITISGKASTLKAGQMIIMPADKPHALKAVNKFKMLLTMIRI